MNAGNMWPAVLACTQGLARSLPSLRGEGEGEGEAGPDGVAATLRQLPQVDPSHYPEYEPPLMAARQRLIQRRRAEEAVAEAQVRWRMGLTSAPRLVHNAAIVYADLGCVVVAAWYSRTRPLLLVDTLL